ncbi:nuclear transport factor 2 family protein [soil metagenome]
MTSASFTLPTAIANYFEASNAGDFDGIAAAFAEDGLVHDEGEDLRGFDAIKTWAQGSRAKYDFTSVPNGITVNGNDIVVTGDVSGTFPGSPIVLTYEFTMVGDKIAHLVIHD